MGIEFKINITKKIKLNGKEYGSIEEVPAEQRELVQNAINSAVTTGGHGKFTVNGAGYDSVEAMPPDVRAIYEQALVKAKAAAQRTGMPLPANTGNPGPLKPEGSLMGQPIVIVLALAGLAILIAIISLHI